MIPTWGWPKHFARPLIVVCGTWRRGFYYVRIGRLELQIESRHYFPPPFNSHLNHAHGLWLGNWLVQLKKTKGPGFRL